MVHAGKRAKHDILPYSEKWDWQFCKHVFSLYELMFMYTVTSSSTNPITVIGNFLLTQC